MKRIEIYEIHTLEFLKETLVSLTSGYLWKDVEDVGSGLRFGGWVVNFLSATPVTWTKPFITGANRSPVSWRGSVLQVFHQHSNTSETCSDASTNGSHCWQWKTLACRPTLTINTSIRESSRLINRLQLKNLSNLTLLPFSGMIELSLVSSTKEVWILTNSKGVWKRAFYEFT